VARARSAATGGSGCAGAPPTSASKTGWCSASGGGSTTPSSAYTHKLWGIAPTEISADWAAQRISLPSLGDVALRLAGLKRGGARTYARRYWYPRLGIGQIFERMAAVAAAHGATFRLGARVTGLERAA